MTKFQVLADRRTTALYLSWEFGTSRASYDNGVEQMRKLRAKQPNANPYYDITHTFSMVGAPTRRNCERLAARVREAAAFQSGRLGKSTFCTTAFVKRVQP